MALVCPRCATQNPDGNSFCQACGSPLNAPPPAPAMPVAAAPASPSISTPTSASNAGLAVPLLDGWVVDSQDSESITLVSPSGTGSITIASGSSSPLQSAQQNKATVDAFFKEQFPDTKSCTGSKTTTGSLNGVAGISWELCFTLTSGAQSVPAAALLFVGANPSGSVYYAMYMLTVASNMPAFSKECAPILKGIQCKLK